MEPKKNDLGAWGRKYGLLLAVLVLLAVWLLPTPEGMQPVQHQMLAIFCGMVVLWITQCVSFATSGIILIPVLYLWVGNATGAVDASGHLVRSADFALAGYGTSSLWLLVAGYMISTAMIATGLAKRLALLMLKRFGKTPFGATLSPMIAGLILAPLTPSNTARCAAILPIVEGVAQAYKLEKGKSNFGKVLYLANMYSHSTTAGAFLTGTIPNPVAIGMMLGAMGGVVSSQTSWGFWAIAAFPTSFVLLIATIYLLFWLFPSEIKELPGGLSYIDVELAALGPVSAREKRALGYFMLALLLWSTDMVHHLNSTMVALLVSALMLLPRFGVLSWKEAQQGIPWDLFVFFGGVITLSGITTTTGAFAWVINSVIGGLGLEGVSMLPLLIAFMGFQIFSHVIWSTTTAMAGVMIPIYIGIAQAFGFPIVGFVLPLAILGSYAWFLPFNTMTNIIMYGPGYFTVAEQLKSSILLGLIAWALWAVTALTWFPLIGLY
ncbi:DASS family sodium-coupled anion symporter [Stenotrophomonas sp. MMGLT7]|uniref:SLC13 family permease n=1 Tax=Stenotrophomonas sp. MMGLT7 TaxID=2901227 RepID=UPI001E551D95|nr:DASS family sodium-coupled anion symporter [Stenotrophomonas sp. MMGLT7]MCD7098621.1 anion permease [Stenotrophomonas sp. MMGLT7]